MSKPTKASKTLERAHIMALGKDVFGSDEKLKLWLDTPSFALGNLKPSELLRDAHGRRLVLAELHCISHGILC